MNILKIAAILAMTAVPTAAFSNEVRAVVCEYPEMATFASLDWSTQRSLNAEFTSTLPGCSIENRNVDQIYEGTAVFVADFVGPAKTTRSRATVYPVLVVKIADSEYVVVELLEHQLN